jgi:hypothetical protein
LACRSDGRDQSFSRRFTPAPTGTTAVIPLDLSGHLGTPCAATSPALLASFLTVAAGESVRTAPVASSELYYVIGGAGRTTFDQGVIAWEEGTSSFCRRAGTPPSTT